MSPRSFAAVFDLLLLTSGLAPLGAGHPADLVGEAFPEELPAALDPACARLPGTCGGVEESLGDLDETGVPGVGDDHDGHHEVEEQKERLEHVAEDHVLPGACADASLVCGKVDQVASGNALRITAPSAHAGARPGSGVTVSWDAEAIDHAQTGALFRVQARDLSGDEWTDVGPYACSQSAAQAFPAGSCAARWTPAAEGLYALRVVALAAPVDDRLCVEGFNCDLVAPFHVDATPPTAAAPCVLVDEACADPARPLTTTTLSVTASATDLQGVVRLVVTAASARGSVSCLLYEGTPVPATTPGSCALPDVAPLLSSPSEGLFSGSFALSVQAWDAAGNAATAQGPVHDVETAPDPVAVTSFEVAPAPLQNAGRAVGVTFRVVYGSPGSQAGLPVVAEPFTVKRGNATVCAGVTTASGSFDCALTGVGEATFVAGVTPREGLASAPHVFTLTWTSLVLTRLAAEDLPFPTLTTDVGGVYRPAYRVSFSHDASPVAGALVRLKPSGQASYEATDADGFVRVPVLSATSAVVSFATNATHSTLGVAGSALSLTWTRLVPLNLTADDALVGAGGNVTLTGRMAYQHNATQVVDNVTLGIGPGAAGCVLLEGGVTAGNLRAVVRCSDVRAAPVPLVVRASARGVTSLSAPLAVQSAWTRVNVSEGALDRAFVDVNGTVTFNATATYEHDGSPVPSGALGVAPGSGCVAAGGGIAAGVATLSVRCPGVLDASGVGVPIVVASNPDGVLALARPVGVKAVWTAYEVTDLRLDRAFMNVGDALRATARVRYAHDSSLPVPDLDLASPALPSGCVLLEASVRSGVLGVQARCDKVKNLSAGGIPLAVLPNGTGITALKAPLALKAVWTQVKLGPRFVSDAFLNAGESTFLQATATYAHDNSPVAWGTLALAEDAPADCALEGGIAQGWLAASVRCTGTHNFTGAPLAIRLVEAPADVTRLAAPLNLSAVWTRVVVSGASLDDTLVDAGRNVTLTARATYEHDGSPVLAGTVGLGSALPGCSAAGVILAGNLTATVSCGYVVDATGEGIPLALVGTEGGVVNLTAPLAARAIWTKVAVSYALDDDAPTLGSDTPVLVTATLTFAHDGSPVASGIASVSGGPGDETQCVTDEEGVCAVEVSRSLGRHAFNVTGFSTRIQGGLLVPDVTAMAAAPPSFSKRWTAIAFLPFECRVAGGEPAPCADAVYAKGTQVTVTVRAVAADDPTQALADARIRLDAQELRTDAEGRASKVVVRASPGVLNVTARGLSALIDGEDIRATVVRVESIGFE